jgi:xanthine dehydrogenase accessory factor
MSPLEPLPTNLNLLSQLQQAWRAGEPVALATVVAISGSAPRPTGSSLLLRADGAVVGAVSGGCVEGAVVDAAERVLESGISQSLRFEAADGEDPFSVGLTCGGVIELVVERIDASVWPHAGRLFEAIAADRAVRVATRLDCPGQQLLLCDGGSWGSLGSPELDRLMGDRWQKDAKKSPGADWPSSAQLERLSEAQAVVIRDYHPRPPLWIFGAIDTSAALASLANALGFRVVVCDARAIFATKRRFPMADQVICEWPHHWLAEQTISADTVICVLTHDPKFDIPVLKIALRSEATYVGAMGSRKTHGDRLHRLAEAGLSAAEISRLRSPIGLDLGGRTPQETALSIMAEVVMLRQSRTGHPLSTTQGAIHP